MKLVPRAWLLVFALTFPAAHPAALPEARESAAALAVADPPGPGGDLVGLTQRVREALSSLQRQAILSPTETRDRMTGGAGVPSLAQVDAAYLTAVAKFRDGDHAAALAGLRGVLQEIDCVAHVGRWSQAMMRLAGFEDQLGHADESHELLVKLLSVDPGAAASLELFRPSFLKSFEAVRQELRTSRKSPVTIVAGNPHVHVCLEGQQVASGSTVQLAPGTYTVKVGGIPGIRLPSRTIEVKAQAIDAALDVGLAEAFRPDAGPGLSVVSADAARVLRPLGAWLRVDRAFLVSLQGDRKERYLVVGDYSARTQSISAEARLRIAGSTPPPGGIEALAALVAGGESSPLVELGLLSLTTATAVAAPVVPEPPPVTRAAGPGTKVTVHLKQGATYRGVLVRKTETALVLRTADGSTWSLPLADISRIEPPQP